MEKSIEERIEEIKEGNTKRGGYTDQKTKPSKVLKKYRLNSHTISRKIEKTNNIRHQVKEYDLDYKEFSPRKDHDK